MREMLSGGDRRSIADSNRARAKVEGDPSLVGELVALTRDDDWLVALRALDLLEKLAHRLDRTAQSGLHRTAGRQRQVGDEAADRARATALSLDANATASCRGDPARLCRRSADLRARLGTRQPRVVLQAKRQTAADGRALSSCVRALTEQSASGPSQKHSPANGQRSINYRTATRAAPAVATHDARDRVENRDTEWYADEEMWEATYPMMFPATRFAEAPRETHEILSLIGRTSGSVLDLACGPARISAVLVQRGFTVTGVDRSPFLLARARERAAELEVSLELVHSDMRDFQRPNSFDVALSLFTSFGYFRDDADNQRVLDNVFASLRPAGVFVMDMGGKEVLARIFRETSSEDIPGGLMVQRRRAAESWTRMENEWILVQNGVQRTFHVDHWIYSAREISQMLERAGFDDVRVFGDYLGRPYGTEAKRLVVVATKGAAL